MTKSLLLLLVTLLHLTTVYAAGEVLLYHVNKQVYWMHDGKKDPAKRGVFLLPKQSLLITSQSNVMLVQQDGKSMLLEKPGTYTYNQIQLLMQKLKAESVSKNFFVYVFEKFLSGNGEEKQKVAAVVYRGKKIMINPDDSSFCFSTPLLFWKPESLSIPYKIEINVNGTAFDTIIRKQTSFLIPQRLLFHPVHFITWTCYPADSRQKPQPFVLLIPKNEDTATIEQQLQSLERMYNKNPKLMRVMKKDLFMQWYSIYNFK